MVTQPSSSSCRETISGQLCEVVLVPEETFDYRHVLACYASPLVPGRASPVTYCKDVPLGEDPSKVPWVELRMWP